MSKTLWYPFPVNKPRSWLLGNGEVVTEPMLEQSGSGQKLRVVGTETSAYARDMDTIILAAVQETARAKNTYVWQPLHERTEKMFNVADIDLSERTDDLYLLRPGDDVNQKGDTTLWWTFRHPEFPAIEALLVLHATSTGGGHYNHVKVVLPDTRIVNLMETEPVVEEVEGMYNAWYYRLSGPEDSEYRSWAVGNPPPSEWSIGLLGGTHWTTERQVVQRLLKLVDVIDGLATIEIPDMRDFDDIQWMELELDQTNYNSAFRQSLSDYLSGSTAVEQAVQTYNDLRGAMRSLGIMMGPLDENDFQRALLEGEDSALRVEIEPLAEEEHPAHTLRVHLASGTFSLTCPVRHAPPDEVAHEWEKLHTIAALTGEEPALLAFAKEYGRTKDDKRARKVMRDRMKGASED